MRRCLDTTFLSDLIRGKADAMGAVQKWDAAGDELVTTAVNFFEVRVGIGRESPSTARELAKAWKRVAVRIECAHVSADAADVAAAAQVRLMGRGRTAPLADLFVAATALASGCQVIVTRDETDFRSIGLLRVEPH